MKYLISYDIAENKIRNRVMKYLEGVAFRIQYSVFTYKANAEEADAIWAELLRLTKKAEDCRLLMAPLCASCDEKTRMSGKMLEDDKGFAVI